MKNKEKETIKKIIRLLVQNRYFYNKAQFRNDKFIVDFGESEYVFNLSSSEMANIKNGIYNDRTRLFKYIEYINKIQRQDNIECFKSNEEELILKDAIKKVNSFSLKLYMRNLLNDLKNSFSNYIYDSHYSIIYIVSQALFGGFSFASLFYLSLYPSSSFLKYSILLTFFPTIAFIEYENIKLRIKTLKNYLSYEHDKDVYLENIDLSYNHLTKNIKTASLKETNLNQKTAAKQDILQNSFDAKILNVIYNLLIKISESKVSDDEKNRLLLEIESIKEDYSKNIINYQNELKLNEINSYVSEIIKRIDYVETELNQLLNQNNKDIVKRLVKSL